MVISDDRVEIHSSREKRKTNGRCYGGSVVITIN